MAVVKCAIATFWLVSSAPAMAGDGNTLYLLQNSVGGAQGNTLTINQTLAFNSSIVGSEDGSTPAAQIGGGNLAEVTLEGEGGFVLLHQDSSLSASLLGNSAYLFGGEQATIALQQLGANNYARIDVFGSDNSGSLYQEGEGNHGTVAVDGEHNSGTLNQIGNNNVYSISVSGSSTDVTFNQIGNNLAPTGLSASVYSSAGTVVITQTVLP